MRGVVSVPPRRTGGSYVGNCVKRSVVGVSSWVVSALRELHSVEIEPMLATCATRDFYHADHTTNLGQSHLALLNY